MDKKHINIDDLVRQRLGGVEESERDGAWMRMSELLDREPKRKRPGFFFWRNTLGAVSALVLLGLAGMASYKVSSSYSEKYTQSEQLVASAMDGKASAALTIPAMRKEVVSNHAASGNSNIDIANRTTSSNRKVVGKTNDDQATAGHDDMQVTVNNELQVGAEVKEPKTVFLRNSNSSHTNNKKATAVAMPAAKPASPTTAVVKNGHNKTEHPTATAINTIAENKNNKSLASNNAQHISSAEQKHTNAESKTAGTPVVAPATEAATAGKLIVAAHVPTGNKAPNGTGSQMSSNAAHADVKETVAAGKNESESVTAKVIADAIAASKHAADTKTEQATTPVTGTFNAATAANATKTALNTTGTKNKINYNQGTTGKKASGHRTSELPLASAPANEAHSASKTAVQEPMEKAVATTRESSRVINKLLLRETYIKTAPNDGYFKLDTISIEEMEMLVKQHSVEAVESPIVVAAEPKKKNVTVAGKEETHTGAEVAADPNVLAASKEESATPQGTVVKEKTAAKKTISTAEKLSLAFNDIKSSIRGTQFAPGLTGGINGTFFGPSGIRGFQFGVTGELIFNDNVSVKGELKYFNRMNSNDFELKDDYYTYTANGGQYVRTQQMHSVSFATIHSLELPISVRYSSGKFSFFAGGNTVYSFGVNASESTLQAPGASVVAAKGNDNNPTITEGDFGSRLGLGYLFGMSYQAAPNFIIDLRNVQTVWDNASSQGSRTVSSQLYKHPSIQLSVGYRLGGKKSED